MTNSKFLTSFLLLLFLIGLVSQIEAADEKEMPTSIDDDFNGNTVDLLTPPKELPPPSPVKAEVVKPQKNAVKKDQPQKNKKKKIKVAKSAKKKKGLKKAPSKKIKESRR